MMNKNKIKTSNGQLTLNVGTFYPSAYKRRLHALIGSSITSIDNTLFIIITNTYDKFIVFFFYHATLV